MRRTPLNAVHKAAGATMVDFAGWEMPVHYTSLVEEHTATRQHAGLFDLCHMGRVAVLGPDRAKFCDYLVTNDIANLAQGSAHYALMCNEKGTIIDDVIVYTTPHFEKNGNYYLIVINAGNRDKDIAHIREQAKKFNVKIEDWSEQWCMLAIQGPQSQAIMGKLTSFDLSTVNYFSSSACSIAGVGTIIARTGYTGEDGFELYFDAKHAEQLWKGILEAGKNEGIKPVGLGARDTLRLEAGMPLYGHEIDDTTNPLEAGLNFAVKLDKPSFIGLEVLRTVKEQGVSRKLVGWEVEGKRVPRQGYPCMSGAQQIGQVTSGTFSPSFQKALGMGYLPVALAKIGTKFQIDIRGKAADAVVVKKPFYKREKA